MKSTDNNDGKNCLDISVKTDYLPQQSDPDNAKYFFRYTVTIVNSGEQSAKLISRHWIIADTNGKTDEVRGAGVVGEQPELQPGEGFRYTSGAMIETPRGSMHGSYQMIAADGAEFNAPIAPFSLSTSGIVLH